MKFKQLENWCIAKWISLKKFVKTYSVYSRHNAAALWHGGAIRQSKPTRSRHTASTNEPFPKISPDETRYHYYRLLLKCWWSSFSGGKKKLCSSDLRSILLWHAKISVKVDIPFNKVCIFGTIFIDVSEFFSGFPAESFALDFKHMKWKFKKYCSVSFESTFSYD